LSSIPILRLELHEGIIKARIYFTVKVSNRGYFWGIIAGNRCIICNVNKIALVLRNLPCWFKYDVTISKNHILQLLCLDLSARDALNRQYQTKGFRDLPSVTAIATTNQKYRIHFKVLQHKSHVENFLQFLIFQNEFVKRQS